MYKRLFVANHSLSQASINKCIIFLFTAIYIVCSGDEYTNRTVQSIPMWLDMCVLSMGVWLVRS